MKTTWKNSLMAAGLAALAACSAKEQDQGAAHDAASAPQLSTPAPNDADAQHSALLAAAEPFENLTEQAATATSGKLDTLIGDARKAGAVVAPSLTAPQHSALDDHLAAIDAANKNGDRTAIALAAVEGYRTLVESASDTGPVPRAVSLLDYAGFRYEADLAATPPHWTDAATAANYATSRWSALGGKVGDTALKDEVARAVGDMNVAAKTQDPSAARSAVGKELDLVDKLEAYFTKRP
ncbi:MAG: hypothetical protein GC201_07065 [Alphaproteobacteria bacterium]|nr:hypothetical protein [Alphaproteobacteria bacterium]